MLYKINEDYECRLIENLNPASLGDLAVLYRNDELTDEELPTWANVQFSVSYPIPDDCYDGPEREGIWSKPDSSEFLDGRYRGISRFRISATKDSNPIRVFYQEVNQRFSTHIASSMEAAVEGAGKATGKAFRWLPPVDIAPEKVVEDPPQLDGSLKKRLELLLSDSAEHTNQGILELVCFEVLQYPNPIHQKSWQRFLVVHLVAVDCTEKQIEKISQALTKVRNRLTTLEGEVSLLEEMEQFISEKLNSSGEQSFFIKFAKGGFLQNSRCSTVGQKEPGHPSNTYAMPMRSVCAFPNVPPSEFRKLPEAFQPSLNLNKNNAEPQQNLWDRNLRLWGAQMVDGYDFYSQEMPSVDSLLEDSPELCTYENWEFVASRNGFVALRQDIYSQRDCSILNLCSTRYVDSLILIQRSYMVLYQISNELRNVPSVAYQATGSIRSDNASKLEGHHQRLLQVVNSLLRIQNNFAEIRKTLWFNAIPKRTLDTHLMRTLRHKSGVEGMYQDLIDEVELRQQIYNLTYHEHDAHLTAYKTEQEKRSEWSFNVMIFVVATAVAIPSYVALLVENENNYMGVGGQLFWWSAGITLAAVLLYMGWRYLYIKRPQGSKNTDTKNFMKRNNP